MTVITSADRARMRDAGQLFETMMAYAGKYRLEDDKDRCPLRSGVAR
jgi:hypothetical protein